MRRGLWLVAVLAALSMVTAACGSNDNKNSSSSATTVSIACDPGTVSGAGSTFVQNIAQQWIKDFQAKCSGATVTYQGGGSGAGITQFTQGLIDFGGTDVPMSATEEQGAVAKGGAVSSIPWSGGGIAIEYNLSGVSNLKLAPDTLAGIFAGKIKTWDATEIKGENSGVTLPSTGIQVIHRSDGSGTSNALTSYLSAVAPTIWTFGASKDPKWPAGLGAKGSDGVTGAVKQTAGAIGYAETSYAKGAALGIASIKNAAGSFVLPDPKNAAAALAEAQVPADLKIVPNYKATAANAYPITTPTWALVFAKPADAAKGKLIKDFLVYAAGPGQSSAEGLYYIPLPSSLQQQVKTAVNSIQA